MSVFLLFFLALLIIFILRLKPSPFLKISIGSGGKRRRKMPFQANKKPPQF
jgi:hypothetical protein